jgi:hypothetical protein
LDLEEGNVITFVMKTPTKYLLLKLKITADKANIDLNLQGHIVREANVKRLYKLIRKQLDII